MKIKLTAAAILVVCSHLYFYFFAIAAALIGVCLLAALVSDFIDLFTTPNCQGCGCGLKEEIKFYPPLPKKARRVVEFVCPCCSRKEHGSDNEVPIVCAVDT